MAGFTTVRDRDAWAAIRGFAYQIDLTIERWLTLGPKTLELERGEDIDIVLDAVISKDKTESRRLEQIKYLDRSISLRTPHTLASLASFYEHLTTNPTAELSFAFITNSTPTVEKPSPMPSSRSAIEVWIDLQTNTLAPENHDWALKGIRAILSAGLKPKAIGVATWTPFVEFVKGSSDEALLTFIRMVEWRTCYASLDQLRLSLKASLATRFGLAIEDAANLYYRLFVHVIQLLSRKGLKRLTSEDLTLQTSSALGTERDSELFDVVRSLIIELEHRVDMLEQKYAVHDRRLGQIEVEISRLGGPGGISASVNYTSAQLILDSPPLVEPAVPRATVIARYSEMIGKVTWCGIRGDIGSGKTQAALLISQSLGRSTLWIRFRGLNSLEACRRLDEGLVASSQVSLAHNWRHWCRRVCFAIPSGSLLVLDDLPRVTPGELLFERLTELAKQISSTTVKVLSTSAFDFPTQLKTIGNGNILNVEEIPRFSDDEIRELFQLHGASNEFFRTNRIGFFAGLTGRHPTVLTAMAVYLATQNWKLRDHEFDALVKREYASEINEQTATALMNSVPDSCGRDLLYRLNLVGDPFTKEDIQRVSGIVPQIEHPFEKISESIGLWIQRDSSNTYVLSPLIHQLGSDNLLAETAKAIHLSLATAVFQRKEIGPPDIALTINHYLSANEHNQAARTLLWALSTMTSQRVETDPWGLSDYWYSLPLPSQIDLGLRIHLRAMQAVVGAQLKKPTDFVLTDLDNLLEEAPDSEANAIAHATIVAGPLFFEAGLSRANRYLLRILKLLPNDTFVDGTPLAYPEATNTAGLIWATIRMVRSERDIEEWFETLEQFSPRQLEQAFDAPLSADSAMALADRLWLWEARKPTKQNWRRVLALLKIFAGRAQRLNAELLWACFIRSQLIVLAEYKKDIDAALTIGKKAIDIASADPDAQFLLKMSIGFQLVQAGRLDEGAKYLRDALAEKTEVYQLYREVSLIELAVAVGRNNPVEAAAIVEQAVEIVRSNPILPESELIKALGEKAISLWLAGDLPAAYLAIREGAERLLATKERDDDAKALFALFGHVSGYLMHLASTGEEIQLTADDSDYKKPEQGMFLKTYPLLVSAYREESVRFLPLHIAYFARALGRDDDLAKWSERGIDEARATGNVTALVQIAPLVLDMNLTNFRIPEAIDAALRLGEGLTAFNMDEKAGRNPLRRDFDVEKILGPKPSEAWMEAESHAATAGLLPFFFHLAIRKMEGKDDLDGYLESLDSVCQQVATTAAVPQLWKDGADLMSDIFRNRLSSKELMSKASDFSQPFTNSLQALTFLGAALDSFPEQAVHNQLETMPLVIDCYRPFKSFYRQILIPFYTLFWSKALRESRFRFRTPDLVQQRYEQLLKATDWTIIPDILTTMASALGVPLGERVNSWLKDKRGTTSK